MPTVVLTGQSISAGQGTATALGAANTALTGQAASAAQGTLLLPLIVANPQDVTIRTGGTARFFAYATGPGTMTYQWYETSAGIMVGETSHMLEVVATASNSGNSYYYISTES